jgi:HD-like signal output (HDOD) protein
MKLKILFVDDEPNVINGLKRMLYFMRSEWDMFFALSGFDALVKMKNMNIDIIISDMRMPGMDGATLLEKVKELYPSTIRIILSGYSDKDLVFKASKSAHQFLAKPIDAQLLKEVIEQLYSLQTVLKNPDIIKIANGAKSLPSLPELYLLIEEELAKPDPSIKKIDDIISKDIVMTARILQIVNSAFFGLPQKIINPFEAVNFLGIEIIKALVLMVHFFSTEESNQEVKKNISNLWDYGINIAQVCKKIAVAENFEHKIIDAVFIGGMLHDVGKLVMWQIDDYFNKVNAVIEQTGKTVSEAEYFLFNASHSEVGAYLLGVWGLPEILVKLIYYHHSPSKCPDKKLFPLAIIHTATHIVEGEPLDENYLRDQMINANINKWLKLYPKEKNYEQYNFVG